MAIVHGIRPIRQDVLCGASAKRLNGANTPDKLVIAIISAGPDKIYQTDVSQKEAVIICCAPRR